MVLDTDASSSSQKKLSDGLAQLKHGKPPYPNMDEMPVLDEGAVLANLDMLYKQEQHDEPGQKKLSPIYSQVGPILIALNPFKRLKCFDAKWQDAFRQEGRAGRIKTAWQTLGPHCYGTIEEVYQALEKNKKQSVVICGESGAGKTYTNKLMLDYLLDIGCARERALTQATSRARGSTVSSMYMDKATTVRARQKDQFEAASEALEAFGNAKTMRNDNSSRFGKYSKLFFEADCSAVSGLKMEHYLLERSRLVNVPDGERNYHIIHMLAEEERETFSKEEFNYIGDAAWVQKNDGKGGKVEFDDEQDLEDFKYTLKKAGFDDASSRELFDVIKGVMYLGNVEFLQCEGGKDGDYVAIQSGTEKALKKACEFLKVKEEELVHSLTHSVLESATEGTIVSPVTKEADACANRDAVAKTIYSKLFDRIVALMNESMGNRQSYSGGPELGLLDIFGFEDMPKNGFEQLFINFTNEWIQLRFNKCMFEREMETYKSEGIDLTLQTQDNTPCVNLFNSESRTQPGIIKLLADAVRQKREDPEGSLKGNMVNLLKWNKCFQPCAAKDLKPFTNRLKKKWGYKVIIPDLDRCFTIKHYAGDVVYTVGSFVSKSKDFLAPHLAKVLKESESRLMKAIFEKEGEAHEAAATIGDSFKKQLHRLVNEELESSGCYFVRCIKPNPGMKPNVFDPDLVEEQLVNGGVMCALWMRRDGLPDRMDYEEFVSEFWCLEEGSPEERKTRERTMPARERCQAMMKMCVGDQDLAGAGAAEDSKTARYRMGATKVFMKSGILPWLRNILQLTIGVTAKKVQRRWRAKKGVNLVVRIGQLQQQLERSRDTARQKGVETQRQVVEAFQSADEKIQSGLGKLQQDPAKWVHIEEARNTKTGQGFTREVERTCAEIPKTTVQEKEVDHTESLVKKADQTISTVVENWARAEEKISELITEKKCQADALLARVAEVEGYCRSDAGSEEQQIVKSCAASKVRIVSIMQQELPGVRAQVLEQLINMDLLAGSPQIELPAKAAELLKEGESLAAKAEKDGEKIVEMRKKFEFETMQKSPETQALQKLRAEAKERLELLEGDSAEAVRDGLTSVSNAMKKAWEWDGQIEELLQKGSEPKRFVDAIKSFLEAEKTVQEAVQLVKKLEAEAKEREEVNLRNVFKGFDKHKELLRISDAFFELLEDFDKHIDTDGQSPPTGVGLLKDTKITLRERVQAAQEAFDHVGFEALEHEAEGISTVRLNYSGPWSMECFKLLGPDLEPYRFVAQVMDEKRFHSVVDTVEALNAGVTEVRSGYCIAWSDTWEQYYMLFQKDREEAVMKVLEERATEIESIKKRERVDKMQRAVRSAIGAVDVGTWHEAVEQRKEIMEQSVRENVKGELETSIGERVAADVASRCAVVQEQAQLEVMQAEAQKSEVIAQKAKLEHSFKEKVQDLESKLSLVDTMPTGACGELPRFHTQLMDAGAHAQRLRTCFEDLRNHISQESEAVEEALAYCDALVNNPETLPGLRDLVEALSRCQLQHTESESLCSRLHLTGQVTVLKEVRAQMTQIGQRIQRVAYGVVTPGSGLEAELDAIRAELKMAAKMMGVLNRTFESWHGRLDKSNQFIEQATACADMKIEGVPDLKENSKQGFWNRMVAGVMENFCVAERPLERKANPQGLVLEGTTKPGAQTSWHGRVSKGQRGHTAKRVRRQKGKLRVGDRVSVLPSRQAKGSVRFVGETDFAAGEWIGVELDTAAGKNDGSVNGTAYFHCEPFHGVFVRPAILAKESRIDELAQHVKKPNVHDHCVPDPSGRSSAPAEPRIRSLTGFPFA